MSVLYDQARDEDYPDVDFLTDETFDDYVPVLDAGESFECPGCGLVLAEGEPHLEPVA